MQVRQQRGADEGGNRYAFCYFLCSSFSTYSPFMFSPSSFSNYLRTTKGGAEQSGAECDQTDGDGKSNAGRNRGASEWEEEAEGRAGGLRRRVGRGEK